MCAVLPCGEENWHIELTLEGYLDVAATSYRTETPGARKNVWLTLQREGPCLHNGWQWCHGCQRRHTVLSTGHPKTCCTQPSVASSRKRKGWTPAGRPGRARHGNSRTLTVEAVNVFFRAPKIRKETRDAIKLCSCWNWYWPSRWQGKARQWFPALAALGSVPWRERYSFLPPIPRVWAEH